MSKLLLSVMGAFAEFERSLIHERQLEGIELAKRRGVYRGRERSLDPDAQMQLRLRASLGESKSRLAVEYGISRQSVYRYLRAAEDRTSSP
jgi:DNA invertase Pin-like site-specific DNA recombinase